MDMSLSTEIGMERTTYSHDALEGTGLAACGPAEAFEAIVAP